MVQPPPLSSSLEAGDRTITSIDAAADRWRAALESSSQPSMDRYLPPPHAPRRREALVTLICIELEVRIRRNELCRVESFVTGYAELQRQDVLKLMLAELRARQNRGEVVKRREYSQRFPDLYEALKQLTSPTGSTVARRTPRRPQPLQAGQSLGDYQILSRLGAGSYADVYLARQKSLGRDVALKVSLGKRNEGRTLARLDHPHIVQVYSEHMVAGHELLVMRYVAGKTLDRWLDYRRDVDTADWFGAQLLNWLRSAGEPNGRARDDREIVIRQQRLSEIAGYLFLDLAKALAHAHDRGVLHLDIKPSNILLDMDGRGLLMDFNVAAMPDENGIRGAQPSGGTLAYMPPEQLSYFAKETLSSSPQIDTRTDLYSLGVVMYEFIAGVSPWPVPEGDGEETLARQLLAQRMRKPAALAKVNSSVSPGLASIVDRLLEPDHRARYPSAAALVDDLRNWFAKRPLTVADVGYAERGKNWGWRHRRSLGMATAMLLGGLFFALGTLSQHNPVSKPPQAATRAWGSADTQAGIGNQEAVPETTAGGTENAASATVESDNKEQLQRADAVAAGTPSGTNRVSDRPPRFRPLADVIRPRKRSPLREHLHRGRQTDHDAWELAINPLTLHGVDLEDNWEEKYRFLLLDDNQRRVVNDAVTEVLLVQLLMHVDEDETTAKRRFFARLPSDVKTLQLMEYLDRQLVDRAIGDLSTSSLLAVAETEFERYLLAMVAAIRNEHETALALLQRCMRENPDRHTTAYYYGLCAERAGRTQDANRAFRRCQEERPKFLPTYFSLAALYARQGEMARASEQFRAVLAMAPQNPELTMRVANMLIHLKRPQQALRALNHLIDTLQRRTPMALTKRAKAKAATGDRAGARSDLQEALQLDPQFREARQQWRALRLATSDQS